MFSRGNPCPECGVFFFARECEGAEGPRNENGIKIMGTKLDFLLQAYLDGTLSPARRAAVERRLDDPKVAARLKRLRALNTLLAASAPAPTPEQSRRLWDAIYAQVAPAAPKPSAWEAVRAYVTQLRLRGGLGLGLAGAAAALVFVLLRHSPPSPTVAPTPSATPFVAEAAPAAGGGVASHAAVSASRRPALPASTPARKAREETVGVAALALPSAPRRQTEVERVLAENTVDDLIENFLRQEMSGAGLRSFRGGRPVAVATLSADEASTDFSAGLDSARRVEGAPDRHGFWNWGPVALALNRRDWGQVQAELGAAEAHAREASERAFAASALLLLSGPGAPLQGSRPVLPATGDLRVLEAGRWQLLVGRRLASFSQGVSVRLPGFRAAGESLMLDLTFDRASFAPGTRFIRVSGEEPAQVFDAAGRGVQATDFTAAAGADYHIEGHELHLR